MGEMMPFHKAVAGARRLALHEVIGRMETRSLVGHREPVFYQGKPTWVEDEALAYFSDEDLKTFGIPDRFKRDGFGNRIQNTILHEPPVALVLAVAAANFPKVYGAKSEINVNQKSTYILSAPRRTRGEAHASMRAFLTSKRRTAFVRRLM
jgi:hypothetical protein